jgi:hypothetical protein
MAPRRGRASGGLAPLAQGIGVPTDAPATLLRDDHHVSAESTAVELTGPRSVDLDVVLVWARRSGRLWVNVTHKRTGRVARIKATPSNALDVFHHPFAYAA